MIRRVLSDALEHKERKMAHSPVFLPSLDEQESNQLNRLLDKLSKNEKIWLSGYLYGAFEPAGSAPAPLVQNQQKIIILYASQSGNAKKIAEATADFLKQNNISAHVQNVAQTKLKKLTDYAVILGVIATYGEGEPPDDALAFFEELAHKKTPLFTDISISTLALGDSSYEFFCQTGHDFHNGFIKRGAKALAKVVEADLDFEDSAKQWQESLLEHFKAIKNAAPSQEPAAALTSPKPLSAYNRQNPYKASILSNQKITAEQSNLDIRHLEIDIAGSGLTYQTGDNLGLYIHNAPSLVAEIIAQIGAKPDDIVTIKEKSLSLAQALSRHLEITAASPKFVSHYGKISGAKKLATVLGDKAALRDYAGKTQIIDVLKTKKTPIKAQDFIAMLRPLVPRLYSIASSPLDTADEVHLTVKIIHYFAGKNQRFGAASAFLSALKEDDEVSIYIEPNHTFRLASDDKNIIMIGNGAGIAPYRAFMMEREYKQAQGKNWLIFNNPNFEQDFLYQTEWIAWQQNKQLNDFDLVWDGDESQISQAIFSKGPQIWRWLQEGAYLYIAGSQNSMAKAAHEALLKIAQQEGQMDEKQSRTWLNQLKSENRYQREIY